MGISGTRPKKWRPYGTTTTGRSHYVHPHHVLFAGAVTQHPGSIRSHAICTQNIQKYSQFIKIQKRRSTRTSLNQTGAGYCFVFKDPEHGFLIRLRQGRGPPGGAARCGWRVVDGAWSGCVRGEVLQVVLLREGGAPSMEHDAFGAQEK